MRIGHYRLGIAIFAVLFVILATGTVWPQSLARLMLPEQRRMEIRAPSALSTARLPDLPTPPTVGDEGPELPECQLSLDEAIRIALANSEVVRVLGGSSGRTIYDPAINNTQIDAARGRFDPSIDIRNDFNRRHTPSAAFDPWPAVVFGGDPTRDYDMSAGLSKTTATGAVAGLAILANPSRTSADGLPLNPRTDSALQLSVTQPLLQRAGTAANLAPITLARIDTERSYYQLKDSVQELVRAVIEAYWSLVAARTEVWARHQQVAQGEEALRRAEGARLAGKLDAIDVAEFQSALANFRASRVSADTILLQREAALRNVLGWPPTGPEQIVPVSPPVMQRADVDWQQVVRLAEQFRPDLIELKLTLEADRQRLLIARNQALPQVDATASYRWDALEGRTPGGDYISTPGGDYTGWQLGVQWTMPLGLRQTRAAMRQEELALMRDRAHLDQGLHNAAHLLAATYRNLAQYYAQYEAFQEARSAAHYVLEGHAAEYQVGWPTLYVNVRLAIADWGNAVAAEARALTQYNTELAGMLRQTGTILEVHGIRFTEEQYHSTGPLGRWAPDRHYARDRRPCPNEPRYQTGDEPAENVFDLDDPMPERRDAERLPRVGP